MEHKLAKNSSVFWRFQRASMASKRVLRAAKNAVFSVDQS